MSNTNLTRIPMFSTYIELGSKQQTLSILFNCTKNLSLPFLKLRFAPLYLVNNCDND